MPVLELLIFLTSILAVVVVTAALYRTSTSRNQCTMPEAGGGWPVIGHLLLFVGEKPAHEKLGALADKYGPVFSIRFGSARAIVLNGWEAAKEIFTVHDKAFSGRPNIIASETLGYNYYMFGLAPYGAYWREVRRIATIELLSNQRLALLQHIRDHDVKTAINGLYKSWIGRGSPNNGVMVEMKQWFANLLLSSSLRVVVGKRYGTTNQDRKSDGEAASCKKSLRKFSNLLGAFVLSDAIPALRWLDLRGYQRLMKETAKELDELVGKWLEEHKRRRLLGTKAKEDEDFMDVMLNIIEEGQASRFDADIVIKSTCLNLLAGGADTTMVAAIWALCLLVNHPVTMKKAQEELDNQVGKARRVEESDVKNLVYLQAIIKETFRLYPPTPINGLRVCREDCNLSNGYHVPAGTRVFVNAWRIHRDERVWAYPNEFIPERFLTDHKHIDVRGQNFELIPFGAGRRACPGISLALNMIHLTLASLLQSFDLRTLSGEPVDMTATPGLTHLKATQLEVVLAPRLGPELYEI